MARSLCAALWFLAVVLGDAVPGAAIAVHTFGDFQQFNPQLHLIATDGCFSDTGTFTKSPGLEDLARYIIRACFSQQRMTYIAAADALDG
jgi:hypothetical protein